MSDIELQVGQAKATKLNKELLDKTQQKSSYLRNIASKTKELPELEKRTKDSINKEVERFESEFTYQSILPKPQLKTYLSPEFQSELKDITEGHFFRQKLSGLAGVSNDQQSLKAIATKSIHEGKKRHIEPLEIKNNDPRLLNMQRIRSTESSWSSTPVSTTGHNKNIKGRTFTENGSASVGPKKMTKNNIQMSIAEVAGKNKTPGKSFIYRMNTSFSTKEGKTVAIGSTAIKTESESIEEQPEKAKVKVTEIAPKRQNKISKENSQVTKTKPVNEYLRLKHSGDLKYMPKLWIDVPMTAQRTKFTKLYFDNEGKWIYRMISRDEYMRKDQIRSLDSGKIPKVIYDSVEKSPYYTDNNYPYFDEK